VTLIVIGPRGWYTKLRRGTDMPLINVKLIEGVFTASQKREMISRLTDTMVDIEGEALRPVTWVVVEEVKSGDWGVGGAGLTTGDVKALQQQQPITAR
jgi:4-oxalocrotonate tautomerase